MCNDNAGEDDCRVARSKRRKEISKKLTDYLVQSGVGQSYLIENYDDDSLFKEKFKYNIYDNVIEKVVVEFNLQFSVNLELYELISSLDPKSAMFLGFEKYQYLQIDIGHFSLSLKYHLCSINVKQPSTWLKVWNLIT